MRRICEHQDVKELDRELRELDALVDWAHEEDLRLRRDPEMADLMAEADAEYERRYGKPWVNPKQDTKA